MIQAWGHRKYWWWAFSKVGENDKRSGELVELRHFTCDPPPLYKIN